MAAVMEPGFRPGLVRAEVLSTVLPVGGHVTVSLRWANFGDEPASRDYWVLVHCRMVGEPEDDVAYPLFGGDFAPACPTRFWWPGRLVRESVRSAKAWAYAKPGKYALLVGLYSAERGEALPLANPECGIDGRLKVCEFEIVPPGEPVPIRPWEGEFLPPPEVMHGPEPVALPSLEEALRLHSKEFAVYLDARKPVVLGYQHAGEKAALGGALRGREPEYLIYCPEHDDYAWSHEGSVGVSYAVHAREDEVRYRVSLLCGKNPAADLTIRFRLKDESLKITLTDVGEHDEHEFVEAHFPHLVTVSAGEEGAKLVVPTNCGRMVEVTKSAPGGRALTASWFDPIVAGMIYHKRLLALVEVPSLEDEMQALICESPEGEMWGSLSVTLRHRHRARRPAEQFICQPSSSASVSLMTATGAQELDWSRGAAHLRERVRAEPDPLYAGSIIYKILQDCPGWPEEKAITFKEAEQILALVRDLTDGARQVVYLVGWQHEGHDTGYPHVFVINERLGSHEDLCDLIHAGERYDAIVSLHDNYDDTYPGHPGWDAEVVCRDEEGNLRKGGVWGPGQAYVISPHRYLRGGALERVRKTLKAYPISKSYHIDVMSFAPRILDFNPSGPASAQLNLQAKLAIVREFNRHGVDVTSEGLTAPFVGRMGHFWHVWRSNEPVFVGDSRIPLVPFIFHGKTTYGCAQHGAGIADDAAWLEALLYGCTFSEDFTKRTPPAHIADRYYLVTVPWALLCREGLHGYQAREGRRKVSYGKNSFIEAAEDGSSYQVVVERRVVSRDFTTFAPGRNNCYLAYARKGGQVRYPAPRGWKDAQRIEMVPLGPEKPPTLSSVSIADGEVVLVLPAGIPCRLVYR